MRERPIDRGAQVALLAIEPAHRGLAGLAEDRVAGRRRDAHAFRGERAFRLAQLAQRAEALVGVFPQQRVEAEPGLRVLLRRAARGRLDPDQALVGERLETVDDVDPEISGGIHDRLRRRRGPTAGEDAEPGEQAPLGRREELVAPGDRGPQGLLSLRQVAGAAPEVEAVPEAVADLRRATACGCAPRRAPARAAGRRAARRSRGWRPWPRRRGPGPDGAHALDPGTARRRPRPRAAARGGRARR